MLHDTSGQSPQSLMTDLGLRKKPMKGNYPVLHRLTILFNNQLLGHAIAFPRHTRQVQNRPAIIQLRLYQIRPPFSSVSAPSFVGFREMHILHPLWSILGIGYRLLKIPETFPQNLVSRQDGKESIGIHLVDHFAQGADLSLRQDGIDDMLLVARIQALAL